MAKKILVIDDDTLVIKSISRYLKTYGYDIVTALSGQEAIEKAERTIFDLIISDVRMPGMDGIETLKTIRDLSVQNKKEKTPAVIITGYAGDKIYDHLGELGIVECIYKPFDLDQFIEIVKKNLILPPQYEKEITADFELVHKDFITLTNDMSKFILNIKNKFDEFDETNENEEKQINFIKLNKEKIFSKLTAYFEKAWDYVKNLEKNKYISYQEYFQQILGPLLLEPVTTNRHVYQKPLGYSGDFIMMNYIYDYNGNQHYLGNSSYEKLINNYTCNIPISCSNIQRKKFLKKKILESLKEKDKTKILSVACGPARELVDLLKEKQIRRPLLFKCLDFEERALDYIKNQIKTIESANKELLSIEYICRDITSIIRDKALKEKLKAQDLIYAFGIFDYLSDRMASRLTKELYQLLDKEGKLIICNASLENRSHVAYYELLGEWHMVHRSKEEMLSLARDISNSADIKFEQPSDNTNYLFLVIKKP